MEQLDTVQGRQGCQQAGVQAHGQQVPEATFIQGISSCAIGNTLLNMQLTTSYHNSV